MEDDQLRDEDYALMMNQGGSSDLAQLRSLNVSWINQICDPIIDLVCLY